MPSIAVVGGGFGGAAALVMLHRAGYADVTVFERSERLGGVWHDNTYPGAVCDIPSHLYEFSFAPNPRWSRRYAPQPEIQEYVEEVVREHGVQGRVRTGVEVTIARWDPGQRRWHLSTSAGPAEADILITACGQLSTPQEPAIPGLERFAGPAFHSARWRHDVPLEGRAGGRDRDRLQRDPDRPGHPAGGEPARPCTRGLRAGRFSGGTLPTATGPGGCSSASPRCSAQTGRPTSPSTSLPRPR
ncbi:MAG TPA: NAD(P)/FAD-dependent oxidoreductase [Solirubrobacteraceae bacterium]|nr:NAD(P)/FAD-dependent oxidoreductase [Solirubrobacteraceae bacterium]